jgi:hypothetical protein
LQSIQTFSSEVIELFEGIVIFKQYIPKKHRSFGINIYKLCIMNGNTYSTNKYLGKDRQNVTQTMTATHVTMRSLTGD